MDGSPKCRGEISGPSRRNGETLVGIRPNREKEILGFFKEIFSANFNRFSGKFSADCKWITGLNTKRENCVLAKLLFYEFPEEEGK